MDGESPTIQPLINLVRLGRVARAIASLLQRFNRTLDMQVAEALFERPNEAIEPTG
jgi:hypothetical protein